MNWIRGALLHMCVICSLVSITAKILDWYNPYMDFTGHIWALQMILYVSVMILGVTRKYVPPKKLRQKKCAEHVEGKCAKSVNVRSGGGENPALRRRRTLNGPDSVTV